jgi:NAD(P)-dependent dehydrogenase (short-subunit alcohol dehydrogenase family)
MSLTYVVIAASRGLGPEFVKQLSAKGHYVFALARNPDGSGGLKSLVENKKAFALKAGTTCGVAQGMYCQLDYRQKKFL